MTKAVGFTRFGGPDVLGIYDVPDPTGGPGELIVRVLAASVNPTDVMNRAGEQADRMTDLRPPFIPGLEFSGHVVGGDRDGELVMGIVDPHRRQGGAQAELISVSPDSVVGVPGNVDPVAAAVLPMNGLTALLSLEALDVFPGETVLVSGAAGVVGAYVLQLGRHRGLHMVAVAAEADLDLVRSLGADDVVARGDNLDREIRARFPEGIDRALDAANLGESLASLVSTSGRIVRLRAAGNSDSRVRRVLVLQHAHDHIALQTVAGLAGVGILTPRIAEVMSPDEAARAHRMLEAGGARGRYVLKFPSMRGE